MRIAYFSQSYPPTVSGISVAVKRLVDAMAERGHFVLVISASDRSQPYATCAGNLRVVRLSSVVNRFRLRQRMLLYPRRAIFAALDEFKPDVIHSHELMQVAFLALEYGRAAEIPVLTTLHQLPWYAAVYLPDWPALKSSVEAGLWSMLRLVLTQYAAVTAPSRMVSELVAAKTGVIPTTVSNGVDLQEFRPSPLAPDEGPALRARLGLPSRAPIILHVGRLDKDKRVDSVIRAAAQVMLGSEAHLLIVGDGLEKPALISLCASLGIAGRCHFPGLVSVTNGLPAIYRLASVFVTASEIETQGIVLLEAAASGLPIAAVNATCVAEIVHEGVNGFLAQPADIDGLGHAISRILEDPSLAQPMGEESTGLARRHDIVKSFDAYEKLYRDSIVNLPPLSISGAASTRLSTSRIKR